MNLEIVPLWVMFLALVCSAAPWAFRFWVVLAMWAMLRSWGAL